eukprot:scaffold1799_cov191-Amphora_coffeaeformis.AAC.9
MKGTTATATTTDTDYFYDDDDPSNRSGKSVAGVSASIIRATSSRQQIEQTAAAIGVWFPWNPRYKLWWGFTVACTILTAFYETYMVAFEPGGQVSGPAPGLGFGLIVIFAMDIAVNFNLAFYDCHDEIVYERSQIVRNYWKSGMLLVDALGVFPFSVVVLAVAGKIGQDTSQTQYLSLFRLIRLVRLYRVKQLYDTLQYSTKVSFMTLTLTRNFAVALVWTHFNACVFYFIARQHDFHGDDTWIGGSLDGTNPFERYILSLYWSITTFTTVGYGDFSPVNEIEQVFGMLYMMLNIILQAWFIGSITLLIVKQDEKTGQYRDVLQTLDAYSAAHEFEYPFYKRLKTQLKLDFNNREIADELVLKDFPVSVRRKVLRRLYLHPLLQTSLMAHVRQQFVDAFLAACQVEIFSPGEDILQKGFIPSDLYLLVGGWVRLTTRDKVVKESSAEDWESEKNESVHGGNSNNNTSSMHGNNGKSKTSWTKTAGDFINEVCFFTQSPQMETVRTATVCKTLTLSRTAYRLLCDDYPESSGTVLQNLLAKVQKMAQEENAMVAKAISVSATTKTTTTTPTTIISTIANSDDGEEPRSVRFQGTDPHHPDHSHQTQRQFQLEAAETTVQDLLQMHVNKLKDDRTTRFLFAASRGDMSTLCILLNQGIDPNASDYDQRTALMVACVKGQTEVVRKLLEYHANPNLVDMHGSSALLEAATNGHEDCMEILMEHQANLCMLESQTASVLCQAVFDGDVLKLRRLIHAGVNVSAGDYDKRTAVHIAAAEGNAAALRILVEEGGADLSVTDRWNNSVLDEATRAQSGQVLAYLQQQQS